VFSFFKQSFIYSCYRKFKVTKIFFYFFRNASNNFGPALNKHLPIILSIIKKKQDLVNRERIDDLKEILINNGGEEAKILMMNAELK